jgi:POTRA domain-containing FtsQ-type protein/cell division protein FtsQ
VTDRRLHTDRRQRRLSVAPPPVEDLPLDQDPPFLRPERRTRVRRQRRGLTHRVVLVVQLCAVALVAFTGAWAAYAKVMASERLKVRHLEVRGGRFLSEGEVRELLGPAVGENILGLDLAAPWVADALVSRTLPDTLRVEIRERLPLALAEVERLYLMDADGALVDIYGPRTAAFDLPIVRGLGRLEPEARRDRAQRAGALLQDLGDLAEEVSEVTVDEFGDLRVVLRGPGEVLRLGPPPYRKRFLTFLSLRKELKERCPQAEYFDLRFAGRIYAKEPVPSVPAASPPPDEAPADTRETRPVGPDLTRPLPVADGTDTQGR